MSGHVHVEERNGLGLLVLDRPEALNALSHRMVQTVSAALSRWRADPGIRAVLVKAVPGRAFCAGGDIRVVIETARRKGVAAAAPFFFDEYRMNWRIGQLGKPYVALLDGITMGGGVGISVHGSHRIATESTLVAMPETGIGFFPDVGGSHFLPRLPGRIGLYLGLTGARLDGATATRLGIATHYVPRLRLAVLEAALVDGAAIDDVLGELAAEPAPGGLDTAAIARHFVGDGLADILASLAADDSPFASRTLAALREKSPLSVAVTMAQLRRGRSLDLAACLAMEYRMARHFLASSDFAEGVRALLVDKDKRPAWRHARIEDVAAAEIEACFVAAAGGELTCDWND
jgi:enoyl-CoA hydratase/carnithine racemase